MDIFATSSTRKGASVANDPMSAAFGASGASEASEASGASEASEASATPSAMATIQLQRGHMGSSKLHPAPHNNKVPSYTVSKVTWKPYFKHFNHTHRGPPGPSGPRRATTQQGHLAYQAARPPGLGLSGPTNLPTYIPTHLHTYIH